MQSADDVQFGDAEFERLARPLDHLRNGQFEAVGVAFFAGERAELAGQYAVVRVVDIAIDDVAGAVSRLFPAREIRNGTHGVEVLRFEQPERIGVGNAFADGHLVINVAEFAALNEKFHEQQINSNRSFGKVEFDRRLRGLRLIENMRLPRFSSRDRLETCPSNSGLVHAKAFAGQEQREPSEDGDGDQSGEQAGVSLGNSKVHESFNANGANQQGIKLLICQAD